MAVRIAAVLMAVFTLLGAAVAPVAAKPASTANSASALTPTVLAPLPGFDGAIADDINNRGVVVGESYNEDGTTIATRWGRRGRVTALAPLPGHDASTAHGINNRGYTVGTSLDLASEPRRETATLWDKQGNIVALPPLAGFENSEATAVNNTGDIVGVSFDGPSFSPGDGTPTRWNFAGEATALELQAGDTFGKPNGVNSRGEVAGLIFGSMGPYAGVWDREGNLTVLDAPPDNFGLALGINNRGVVVGYVADAETFTTTAAVWDKHGSVTVLTTPDGYESSNAVQISNRGEIVGISVGPNLDPMTPPDDFAATYWDRHGNATVLALPPGAIGSVANGVNARGHIVGFTFDNDDATAVVWN